MQKTHHAVLFSLIAEVDTKNDAFQRFVRDSLVNSFTKVLSDEAVQTWKHEIFVCQRADTLSWPECTTSHLLFASRNTYTRTV